MCEMKINSKLNNLTADVKTLSLCHKKLCFKLNFNSISGNCDPLFSQKNFDHTHYGGFWHQVFIQGVLSGGFMS